MNSAQRMALARPCLLSIETLHPCHATRNGAWTTVVTINTGYE